MATFTTRLGLIKPAYTDDVDVADLNANADDIDAAVGATVCTSTTRPSTPFTGQIIFETNTGKSYTWDGNSWEAVSGSVALINTDGDPGTTIYVGSIDPDVSYTPVTGDVWVQVP